MGDVVGWHDAAQELPDLVAIHQAHVQRRVGVLVGEHVVQREPRQIAILQVFDLFLEHRRLQRPVAVDQREAAVGLACQHRLHDRQDRRDAAAAGDADVMSMRRGIDRHEEAALRRHHADLVAGFQMRVDPVGEHAASDLAHADAQFAIVDAGTDRIRAAQVLPIDVRAQREVLALSEAEHVAQRLGHVERNDHRLVGIGLDRAHAQRMENDAHRFKSP